MQYQQPRLPRHRVLDDEDLPEAKSPDEIPATEDLDGAEKIGEHRYVIRTSGVSGP